MTIEIADSALLETWAANGEKVDPGLAKTDAGFAGGEIPPAQFFNQLFYIIENQG